MLGSGKHLSPAAAPSPSPHHSQQATTSLTATNHATTTTTATNRVLSPSTSSVSLSSQASVSQISSTETQDLTSRISLENGETSISAAPAASGAHLACPICSEEMVRKQSFLRNIYLGNSC